MTEPLPNGDRVELGAHTVELRVCECCKEPKPRYVVYDAEGKCVRMASTWEAAKNGF